MHGFLSVPVADDAGIRDRTARIDLEELQTPFGDCLEEKAPNAVRLVGSTLGSQGLKPWDKDRVAVVKDFIRHTEADTFGAYEVSVQWDNLASAKKFATFRVDLDIFECNDLRVAHTRK